MAAKRALVAVVAAVGLIIGVLAPTSGAQDGGDAPPPPLVGNTTNVSDPGAIAYIITSYPDFTQGSCTGALVAPMWVLTAAHCVQKQVGGSSGADRHALTVEVMLGSVDALDFQRFPTPSGVEIHEAIGWVIHGNYDPAGISDDIALIKLPTASGQPVMPIATNENLVTAANGQTLPARAYGFGQSCAVEPCAGPDVLRTGLTEIVSDDDAEDFIGATIANKVKKKNVFMTPAVASQAAICFGDSGGPLTVMQNGTERIAAVNSFISGGISGTCTTIGGTGRYLNASADVVATGLHEYVIEIITAPALFCWGQAVEIVGSSFPDKLIGTTGVDVMAGRGDDDLLLGFEDDDFLCGGGGEDDIRGGSGNDSMKGDSGGDDISGGDGEDRARGGGGADDIEGGKGGDNLKGGGGDDDINGNGGADVIKGGGGDDDLKGKKGGDTISGGGGDDDINGNGGTDTCSGGAGDNTIRKCEA